jgi:hypothetical protein
MTVWTYKDSAGVERRGRFIKSSDLGGSDVTYIFHRLDESGRPLEFPGGGRRVDCVSGQRLKEANPAYAIRAYELRLISDCGRDSTSSGALYLTEAEALALLDSEAAGLDPGARAELSLDDSGAIVAERIGHE